MSSLHKNTEGNYNRLGVRLHAGMEMWADCISLWAIKYDFGPNGQEVFYAKDFIWEKLTEAQIAPRTTTLFKDNAQALMDQLWTCGLRPTEGAGSAGSLAATERHLEDMRSLVFKTAPKETKK